MQLMERNPLIRSLPMHRVWIVRIVSTVVALQLVALLGGCATLVNGRHQDIEFRSSRPGVKVQLNQDSVVTLPATLSFKRKMDDQILRIITPRTNDSGTSLKEDTLRLRAERHYSYALWWNMMLSLYGIPTALGDLAIGGAYRIDPDPRNKAPAHLQWTENPDPWKSGKWRGSAGWVLGTKYYPAHGDQFQSEMRPEFSFQTVVGRKSWPVEAELRLYLASSLAPTAFVIAEPGIRKTWLTESDFRPYLSGGLSLLNRSTQEFGGLPVGFWTRVGLDMRPGGRVLITPYLGYSKFELVSAQGARNTGGLGGGAAVGMLW
jgi:hypothetical protein